MRAIVVIWSIWRGSIQGFILSCPNLPSTCHLLHIICTARFSFQTVNRYLSLLSSEPSLKLLNFCHSHSAMSRYRHFYCRPRISSQIELHRLGSREQKSINILNSWPRFCCRPPCDSLHLFQPLPHHEYTVQLKGEESFLILFALRTYWCIWWKSLLIMYRPFSLSISSFNKMERINDCLSFPIWKSLYPHASSVYLVVYTVIHFHLVATVLTVNHEFRPRPRHASLYVNKSFQFERANW